MASLGRRCWAFWMIEQGLKHQPSGERGELKLIKQLDLYRDDAEKEFVQRRLSRSPRSCAPTALPRGLTSEGRPICRGPKIATTLNCAPWPRRHHENRTPSSRKIVCLSPRVWSRLAGRRCQRAAPCPRVWRRRLGCERAGFFEPSVPAHVEPTTDFQPPASIIHPCPRVWSRRSLVHPIE